MAKPTVQDLVTSIDECFADLLPGEPAQLLGIAPAPSSPMGYGLAVMPVLADEQPIAAVLGRRAPRSWSAAGIATTGRAAWLAEADDCSEVAWEPIRLTALVERSGRLSALITPLDGLDEPRQLTEPAGGGLPDLLARFLGAPTAPPAIGPAGWLASSWLDRVFSRAVAEPHRRWLWADVAALHPLAGPGHMPSPGELRARVTAASSDALAGWELLRQSVARDLVTCRPSELMQELAGWFDTGSFSRFALEHSAPAYQLLEDLGGLVSRPLAESIRHVISDPDPSSMPGVRPCAPAARSRTVRCPEPPPSEHQ